MRGPARERLTSEKQSFIKQAAVFFSGYSLMAQSLRVPRRDKRLPLMTETVRAEICATLWREFDFGQLLVMV